MKEVDSSLERAEGHVAAAGTARAREQLILTSSVSRASISVREKLCRERSTVRPGGGVGAPGSGGARGRAPRGDGAIAHSGDGPYLPQVSCPSHVSGRSSS